MNLWLYWWLFQGIVHLEATHLQFRMGWRSEGGMERRGQLTPPHTSAGGGSGRWGRAVRSKWNRRHLSYRVSAYSSHNISRLFIDTEIAEAFLLWQQVTDLTFRKSSDFDVDVEIKFVRGEHGDDLPFLDHTLAHAFLPPSSFQGEPLAGSIHFNDAYMRWQEGTTLRHTAAHEIGHALGLTHSNQPEAIMSPYQGNAQLPVLLQDEDVERIQNLYGPPTIPPLKLNTKGPTEATARFRPRPKASKVEERSEGGRRGGESGERPTSPEPPSTSESAEPSSHENEPELGVTDVTEESGTKKWTVTETTVPQPTALSPEDEEDILLDEEERSEESLSDKEESPEEILKDKEESPEDLLSDKEESPEDLLSDKEESPEDLLSDKEESPEDLLSDKEESPEDLLSDKEESPEDLFSEEEEGLSGQRDETGSRSHLVRPSWILVGLLLLPVCMSIHVRAEM